VESPPYFLLAFGLVWASALPATDFVFALVRPLLSRLDALLATRCDVCLGFVLATLRCLLSLVYQSSWVGR
jgi:hypothetical protein